jgi:hypothetical protein
LGHFAAVPCLGQNDVFPLRRHHSTHTYLSFIYSSLVFVSLDRRTIVIALPALPSTSSPPPYRSLECCAGVDAALFFFNGGVARWHPQKTE